MDQEARRCGGEVAHAALGPSEGLEELGLGCSTFGSPKSAQVPFGVTSSVGVSFGGHLF